MISHLVWRSAWRERRGSALTLLSRRCRRRNGRNCNKRNSRVLRSKPSSQHHLLCLHGKLHHTENRAPTKSWLPPQPPLHHSRSRLSHHPNHRPNHLALRAPHSLPCARPSPRAKERVKAKTKMPMHRKPHPPLAQLPRSVACLCQTRQYRFLCPSAIFRFHLTHRPHRAKTSA